MQHARQLRELERLDQEIDGAALDRRDRLLDAAESGDDDGADVRVARQRLVEHFHAVGVGQAQIDDQAVVGEPFEARCRIGGVERLGDRESFRVQRLRDDLPELGVVLDDENRGSWHGCSVMTAY